jgi:hypothetical protein
MEGLQKLDVNLRFPQEIFFNTFKHINSYNEDPKDWVGMNAKDCLVAGEPKEEVLDALDVLPARIEAAIDGFADKIDAMGMAGAETEKNDFLNRSCNILAHVQMFRTRIDELTSPKSKFQTDDMAEIVKKCAKLFGTTTADKKMWKGWKELRKDWAFRDAVYVLGRKTLTEEEMEFAISPDGREAIEHFLNNKANSGLGTNPVTFEKELEEMVKKYTDPKEATRGIKIRNSGGATEVVPISKSQWMVYADRILQDAVTNLNAISTVHLQDEGYLLKKFQEHVLAQEADGELLQPGAVQHIESRIWENALTDKAFIQKTLGSKKIPSGTSDEDRLVFLYKSMIEDTVLNSNCKMTYIYTPDNRKNVEFSKTYSINGVIQEFVAVFAVDENGGFQGNRPKFEKDRPNFNFNFATAFIVTRGDRRAGRAWPVIK